MPICSLILSQTPCAASLWHMCALCRAIARYTCAMLPRLLHMYMYIVWSYCTLCLSSEALGIIVRHELQAVFDTSTT